VVARSSFRTCSLELDSIVATLRGMIETQSALQTLFGPSFLVLAIVAFDSKTNEFLANANWGSWNTKLPPKVSILVSGFVYYLFRLYFQRQAGRITFNILSQRTFAGSLTRFASHDDISTLPNELYWLAEALK
jgi:hypothetical protein